MRENFFHYILYSNILFQIADWRKTISKNILIIGAQRCGKSSVLNFISEKYNQYETLRGDPAYIAMYSVRQNEAFESCIAQREYKDVDESTREFDINLSDIVLEGKQKILYYKTLFDETKIDLNPIGRKIIMDTMDLSVKEAYENFGKDCDIYCFGMPNENSKNLLEIIRLKETSNDWTSFCGNYRLEMMCKHIINYSKKLQEECQKYNIIFFDTSGDREKKLIQAIKVIEEKSILS